MRRKTRFVCVSDTHGYTPSEAGFKLPAGDVLIHAGDLTNQGSLSELRKTIDWISKADFEVKIIVCGNHDITLDANFYAEHGNKFHNQVLEEPRKCMEVVLETSPASIVFLRHQSALVRLTRRDGPNTIFKVFGSPYSQFAGTWAFGYESAHAAVLWDQIPLDADIVVTHTPPHSHCDSGSAGVPLGCKALRHALSAVRPLLSVCGHVHEARGYERVKWSTSISSSASNPGLEKGGVDQVIRGILPPRGSKKQNLVDLTGKQSQRLDNTGFSMDGNASSLVESFPPSGNILLLPSTSSVSSVKPLQPSPSASSHSIPCPNTPKQADDSFREIQPLRRETCIVNAAIMATNWPHRGGRQFHPPIVVDLELPTWTDKTEQ